MPSRVLLAIPDDNLRALLDRRMKAAGHYPTRVADYDAALTLLNEAEYDVLVAAVEGPDVESNAFVREAESLAPQMQVLCVSGFCAVPVMRAYGPDAVEATALIRPIHLSRLAEEISRLTAA